MSDEENPHVVGVKTSNRHVQLTAGAVVGGPSRHRGRRGLATGVALMLLGLLFLLANLRLVDFRFTWDAWPLFIVIFGVVRLIDSPNRGSGLWLIAIGLWLFVNEWEIWGLTYHDSWPLLVVLVGLSMVWKAVRGSNAAPPSAGGSR